MKKSGLYYQNIRPEMQAFLPAVYTRVLEIGCGEGNFRANLNQTCEYWGVELSDDAARIASEKLDKVLVGSYQEVYNDIPDDYFDLVICNDVIEHMNDHDGFLQSLKQKIRQGSYIVGSIPNVRYISHMVDLLAKKDWQYKDKGILDRTHVRFFTEKSLKRMFSENGFMHEMMYGINKMTLRPLSVKRVIRMMLIFLLGKDTRFQQFGFRIRYSNPGIKKD